MNSNETTVVNTELIIDKNAKSTLLKICEDLQ